MKVFTEQRLANDGMSTVSRLSLDGKALGFTLEPGPRTPAHPRKPAGRYPLVLRKEGGKYADYLRRFGGHWFHGIPHIIVPGRTWIEFHIGNSVADTLGCSMPGQQYVAPGLSHSRHYEVEKSLFAFQAIYPLIRNACEAGEVFWETLDEAARA